MDHMHNYFWPDGIVALRQLVKAAGVNGVWQGYARDGHGNGPHLWIFENRDMYIMYSGATGFTSVVRIASGGDYASIVAAIDRRLSDAGAES